MSSHPVLVHVVGWLGLMVGAIGNGALREATFGKRMSRDASHTLSVLPLLAYIIAWPHVLGWLAPLRSTGAALKVGVAWLVLTLAFEFGFGRKQGNSWSSMLAEYDVRKGRLWPLVPLAVLLAPAFARRRHSVEPEAAIP